MKKSKTSASWTKFIKELSAKCKEQEISLLDLVEWIRISIEQIEKKTFDYHVTSGPTPKYPKQKLDIFILMDNRLQGFTIFEDKREYYVYPFESVLGFVEEISGDFISAVFFMSAMRGISITDKVTNSAKLRKFSHKVLNLMWEM